jgi:hypothetical protein
MHRAGEWKLSRARRAEADRDFGLIVEGMRSGCRCDWSHCDKKGVILYTVSPPTGLLELSAPKADAEPRMIALHAGLEF